MADITKCPGIDCPIKYTCYRYTALSDPYYQSWSDYYRYVEKTEDGVKCDNFVDDRR